jgi:hypothetical protein
MDNNEIGLKYDTGKIQYSLIPATALKGLAMVLTHGANKYGPYNWKLVTPVERYYDALLRHLEAVREGQWIDEDSGLPHMDHVMCNAVFLKELWEKK